MLCRICIFLSIVVLASTAAEAQNNGGITPPTLISAPKPVYPKEAREAGIGGTVSVEVTVDETGRVVEIGDITGPARLCGESRNDPRVVAMRNVVADSMRQAKFSPGTENGKPVKATVWASSTFDPFEDGPPDRGKLTNVGAAIVRKAKRMPKPDYPGGARALRASGAVAVRVVVDEKGDVFTAEPVSGHPLLRSAAVDVACKAKFEPTEVDGTPIRITGVIVYNFFPGR